jgi:type IV pilus assembly protein PilB
MRPPGGSGLGAVPTATREAGSAREPDAAGGSRLLTVLLKEGLLTATQAQQVATEHRRANDGLGTTLERLGVLSEVALLDFLSRKYGLPVITLARVEVSETVTALVRKEIVQKYRVFPVRKVDNKLTLALSDPTVLLAVDDVRFATGLHVVPVLASEAEIKEAIDKHYLEGAGQIEELLRTEHQVGADALEVSERLQALDITELAQEAGEAPVIRLVSLVLADAIRRGASDIHLEPSQDDFLVRYRIDGVLHDMMTPPKALEAAILSRVKVIARMDIAERRLPQDGRISVKLSGKDVDLRVSSLPTLFGEKIVLRILDKAAVRLDLEKLGLDEDDRARFERAIRKPYGMILATGPTGSGKTTTLYAALAAIKSPEINIITAEDPVEYNLPRVSQLQVHDAIGLSFSTALRSFLRQDPDVIMVGEMRDTETMQIAIRAALTGHLVLSTLHTNDAPSTVTRLIDMGALPFLVASSLLLVVAQRLCRRICPDCRVPTEVPMSTLLDVGFTAEEVESVQTHQGRGCAACANTGYRGRTAIYEILEVSTDPELQEAIVKQRPASELKRIAVKHGMGTLRQAGLRKVATGLTTLDEIIRVTFAD